ncbi:uncharacterized protein BT62DRAFT_71372 [Guyanagaster necrorhizus]|uniref:Uncharacterized protein n=1 Tax=Guyanagaster necrorhizus TaxID=856835 RepID=A0A9P8AUT9_9AGAR|nr:uncharacterized protein BT62DRAFT_71372 [Guyanagaster necrorhizus MCA 3950]KAG7447247.1 hypothetical protein BT62DRAFT_71372 [Guyanagaster necrorhizus MCA 3950]
MSNADGLIIVDDQDADVSYTGSWISAGSALEYSETIHASNETGASMSYNFTGTYISIYGDYDPGGSCSLIFSLDGQSTTVYTPEINATAHHRQIWASSQLSNGNHTLVYSVDSCHRVNANSSGTYSWFDYILYQPSPGTLPTAKYVIDDTSTDIQWAGNWSRTGIDGDFNVTAHASSEGASLELKFTGSAITVYGRLNNVTNSSTSAAFAIDDGAGETFNASAPNAIVFNEQFFTSAALSQQEHTLTMTALSDAIYIDYFIIRSTQSDSSRGTPTESSGRSRHIGAIAGGTIGGVVGLVAIAVAVCFLLKRGKQPGKNKDLNSLTPPPSAIGTGRRGTVLVRNSVDGSYSLSGMVYSHGQHTRMRSVHATPSDDDISAAPERRLVSHFSIGSSIASSHGRYASPDRYVTYDDPFHIPTQPTTPRTPTSRTSSSPFLTSIPESPPAGRSVFSRLYRSSPRKTRTHRHILSDGPSYPADHGLRSLPVSPGTSLYQSSYQPSQPSSRDLPHSVTSIDANDYFPSISDLKRRQLPEPGPNQRPREQSELAHEEFHGTGVPGNLSSFTCTRILTLIPYSFWFIFSERLYVYTSCCAKRNRQSHRT